MKQSKLNHFVFLVAVLLPTAVASQDSISMPPRFEVNAEPKEILSAYPLGVINKQTAFAHHGQALKKFILPNGNEGWLYKVGEKAGIPSNYVLQFSDAGFVIDVLHKDHRYTLGHSALQYQYLVDSKVKLRTLGDAPSK